MKLTGKNMRVLLAAGLFIILTAVKLLFPEQTAGARAALREAVSRDADYMAVFRSLGESLSADEEVVAALMRMTGRAPGSPDTPGFAFPEGPGGVAGAVAALEPLPESPSPEPSPTPEPTPEPVPEAVSAFLKQQEAYSAYELPSNVSYGYPELPFDYVSPVAGMTSSGFGYRMHPLKNEVLFHYGTDFAAWTGTEILAFASGTVGMVGWDAGFGNYIIVQHSGGWRTLYAHCSAVYVTGGDAVEAGQCIGLVGATGNVTGPHLHLELTCDGVYYNPEFYLS